MSLVVITIYDVRKYVIEVFPLSGTRAFRFHAYEVIKSRARTKRLSDKGRQLHTHGTPFVFYRKWNATVCIHLNAKHFCFQQQIYISPRMNVYISFACLKLIAISCLDDSSSRLMHVGFVDGLGRTGNELSKKLSRHPFTCQMAKSDE